MSIIKVRDSSDMGEFSNRIYHSYTDNFPPFKYNSPWSIKYTVQGSETYYVDNKRIVLPAGTILVTSPSQSVTAVKEKRELSEGISLFLDEATIKEVTDLNNLPGFHESHIKLSVTDNSISQFMNSLLMFLRVNNGNDLNEDFYYHASEVLVKHQKELHGMLQRVSKQKESTRMEMYKFAELARVYILDNLHQPLSLDDISRNVGLSKYSLHRHFREIYGITINDFIVKQRIKKASALLTHSKLRIFEIAQACGIQNTQYFSKFVKKHLGVSPLELRDMTK